MVFRSSKAGFLLGSLGAALVVIGLFGGCGGDDRIPQKEAETGKGVLIGGKDRLFVAEFEDFPDLEPATRIEDWEARGEWVVAELRKTARESQGSAIEVARKAGAVYRSEWIGNVLVFAGEKGLGPEISELPGVERVWEEPFPEFPVSPLATAARPDEPPAALRRLGAPRAWRDGVTGKGVLVGIVDTGVYADHPALRAGYRGYRGPGRPPEHDGSWFSPIRRSADAPVDTAGHGTHIAGSVLGSSQLPGGASIGVAPDAKWIAAQACTASACPLSGVLPGLQFMLAPTDRYRGDPNPSLRPEVVVNSWQRNGQDVALERAVKALEAAGVLAVFAVGNGGPACGSARSPGADPDDVLSVGAVDQDGQIADYSGRGPAPGGFPDPDVVAPGDEIVSSVPRRGYARTDGTSSAAALAAGAAALAIDANPALKGDTTALVEVLREGTRTTPAGPCGSTAGGQRNNSYGYGELDLMRVIASARARR